MKQSAQNNFKTKQIRYCHLQKYGWNPDPVEKNSSLMGRLKKTGPKAKTCGSPKNIFTKFTTSVI